MNDPRHEGRYSAAVAARLVDMPTSTVRRWLATSPSLDIGRAVVARSPDTERGTASFLDLIELHVAKGMVDRGINVQKLRTALRDASERLGLDHPLARRRYLLDGSSLYLVLGDSVVELAAGGQLGLVEVVRDRARVIDFDPAGVADRWWPRGRESGVVVDPLVGYGVPVIDGTGTSTTVLRRMWEMEGHNTRAVADWYGLPETEVEAAVQFEVSLAA